MSLTVTHPFVSLVADSGDTSLVQPSNWNANHTISITGDLSPDTAGGATLGTSLLPWGASFFSGVMTITDTTASTSTSTGALVVAGGVGVAKALVVGESVTCVGQSTYARDGDAVAVQLLGRSSDSVSILQFVDALGVTIYGSIRAIGSTTLRFLSSTTEVLDLDTTHISVLPTTASTSTTTGALVVSGGVGVAGAIFGGANLTLAGDTVTLGDTAGQAIIKVDGASADASLQLRPKGTGAVAAYNPSVGAIATFSNNAGATANTNFIDWGNSSTGNNIISTVSASFDTNVGTVLRWIKGTGKSIFFQTTAAGALLTISSAGDATVHGTTASTSTSTGALIVSGGVGIAGALFLGTNLSVGATSFGTSANNVIALLNGTAPTTSPANTGQLYVLAGALVYRGSGGTVTTVAPA